ncbi:MAG: hypothetical protein ILO53_06005 [Clostridia bacterium]|nr:hypothetical protein [Clostridia bacterium]
MTFLCLIFAVLYEFLGHGVYSWRIRLLFLLPLAMFVLFAVIGKKADETFLPAITALRLLVISEMVRNAFIGIVKVYGTASSKAMIPAVISAVLLAATVALTVVCAIRKVRQSRKVKEQEILPQR